MLCQGELPMQVTKKSLQMRWSLMAMGRSWELQSLGRGLNTWDRFWEALSTQTASWVLSLYSRNRILY